MKEMVAYVSKGKEGKDTMENTEFGNVEPEILHGEQNLEFLSHVNAEHGMVWIMQNSCFLTPKKQKTAQNYNRMLRIAQNGGVFTPY